MNKFYSVVFAISLSAGMVACGGDDGFRNSDTKLSELEPEGLVDLCEDVSVLVESADFRQASARLICFAFSQIGGEQCVEADLDACVDQVLAAGDDGGLFGECVVDTEATTSCDLTVGELEACLRDGFAVFEKFADASCDELVGAEAELEETPASCAAIEAQCPDLFDDGDDE